MQDDDNISNSCSVTRNVTRVKQFIKKNLFNILTRINFILPILKHHFNKLFNFKILR